MHFMESTIDVGSHAAPSRHAAPASRSSLSLLILLSIFASATFAPAGPVDYEQIHVFGMPDQMGELPCAPPIRGSDGALYGVAEGGGLFDLGAIYRCNADGTGYRVLIHFGTVAGDGSTPAGKLLEGSDGALYGLAYWDGTFGQGAAFKVNKDGSGYVILHPFGGSDGRNPDGWLTEGSDGFLYGSTRGGGSANLGVVFRMRKDGADFQVLHEFGVPVGDGRLPIQGLIEGSDGWIYGVTEQGGSANRGTVYRISKDGSAPRSPA